MFRIIWPIFFLLFSFSLSACLKEGGKIVLTGVIKKEIVYGPPDWGEIPKNDKKMEYWFLYPGELLSCTFRTDDNTVNSSKKIQMIMSSQQYKKYRYLFGENIKVSGRVMFSNSPYHFTPILIYHVSNIELTTEENQ
ncbi:DUF4431 domain-containing protein [Serratia aquatilis]|uniref:DUF4431 domain-containing protein n=1 Tax=Serratia aquatilis TaxID=1737515 RepID=A0ABV6EGM5_9GAMM